MLDPEAEQAVRTEWDALASAGMSSLAAHTAASNRPHISLLVRERVPALDLERGVAAGPFAIALGAPVLFGSGERRILARSVSPSVELLALHAAVHVAAGRGDDVPHTRPGVWTPHVTLARRIRVDDIGRALACVGGEIRGRATSLRRWDAASKTVIDLGDL